MAVFLFCHSRIQWTICNQLLKILPAFYETRKSIIVSNTAPRLPISKVKFSPRQAILFLQDPTPSPAPEDTPCHCGASTMKICPYKHHDDLWAAGSTAPLILNHCTSWRWLAVRHGRLTPRKWATSTHYTEGFLGPRAGLDALEERKISYSCRESSHNYSVYQTVA